MRHTLTRPPPASPDLAVNPTFNVVIAYEDFETGKHARRTYDFLAENLGQDCAFANQMWKFDVLRIPKLHELAVNDALVADIIMISSRGGELPRQVQTWIEGWLAEPHSAIALVALFAGAWEETVQTRAGLAVVAQRGKMEFFAQPDGRPSWHEQPEEFAFEHNSQVSRRTLEALTGVVKAPPKSRFHDGHWAFESL